MITEREQLVIKDRSKDMIKSGGEWISSVDMENLVVALPEVAMAAVVAVPHPKWDERPVVVCTLHKVLCDGFVFSLGYHQSFIP